jgi:hypothetical protein
MDLTRDLVDLAAWLRRRIEERKCLAGHAIELGSAAEWTELSSGVLMTIAPDAPQDTWDGVWPMGDSSLTRLMEANDPRDTIARCEAELAILDLHASNDYERYPECVHCAVEAFPCRTVRHLGYGYRHRPGYREEWKP